MLTGRRVPSDRPAQVAARLPNLVIIGAMKCGTTSLNDYLDCHPEIAMSAEKELEFFIEDRNWSRGIAWYAAQFDGTAPVRGEASPNYSAAAQFPGVPARMHAVLPEARLIYLVRDPVERVVSHYLHNYTDGRESRPLAECAKDYRYIERSLYWTQLTAYLEHYPASRILVVDADALLRQRAQTLREIFVFLGVNPDFYSASYAAERHRSALKRRKGPLGMWLARSRLARGVRTLPPGIRWPLGHLLSLPFSRRIERPALTSRDRCELVERLRPDIDRFREFTGRDFAAWSV